MTRPLHSRLVALGGLVALFGGVVVLRLADLQLRHGEEFRRRAYEHRRHVRSILPRRGDLLDRNGRELAVTVASHVVLARRRDIIDPVGTARRLAPLLEVPAVELERKLRESPSPVRLPYRVSPAHAAAIEAAKMPGIALEPVVRRIYPNRALAAHVLGFVKVDGQPLDGVELSFDKQVHGTDGQAVDLIDANGSVFDSRTLTEAIPGLTLRLTLDLTVQHVLEEELDLAVRNARGRGGAAAAIDPVTGEVLALASWPTFNPNTFSRSSDEEKLDRVLLNAYEPGSTFKVVTAAAVLENRLVRPEEVFDCGHGRFQIGRFVIRDHKSFGDLTFTRVMAESSNVGVMKAGMRLPPAVFHETIRRFGFGERTGMGLPYERSGRVPSPAEWSLLSQPSLSIGQEILVTPMQMLAAVGAVANHGLLVRPWVASALLDADGHELQRFSPPEPRRVVSEETARTLISILEQVVLDGTGKAAAVPGYSVGGKTGTAQKSEKGSGYVAGRYVSSFVGWAPLWKPRLAAIFVVDEPQTTLFHGGDVAAPAFGRFAARVLPVLGVAPDLEPTAETGPERLVVRRRGAEPDPGARWATLRTGSRTPARAPWLDDAVLDLDDRAEQARRASITPEPAGADGEIPAVPPPVAPTVGDPMPDLLGLTSREAVARLTAIGLRPRLQGLGRVTQQQPAPGAALPGEGDECRLWLGSTP
jgi:cell division protein FtsI (penicillin-binding protein 3)